MKTPESITWRSLLGFEVQKSTRREPRYETREAVAIVLQPGFGDVSATIAGDFLDRSKSGCRIRHRFGDLSVGQEVSLVWLEDTMSARVVWNRGVGGATETGFQFVS